MLEGPCSIAVQLHIVDIIWLVNLKGRGTKGNGTVGKCEKASLQLEMEDAATN